MSTPEPIQQHYIQSPSELLPCSGMLNFDTLLITLCIINLALLSLFMCECFFVCKIVVLVVNCFVSLCVYTQDMYFILIVFFLDDVHFIYKYTCGILFCRFKTVLMPFLVNWNLSCGKIWNITINKEKFSDFHELFRIYFGDLLNFTALILDTGGHYEFTLFINNPKICSTTVTGKIPLTMWLFPTCVKLVPIFKAPS